MGAPKGPIGASLAFVASMSIGMAMGMFHYPNTVLENGTGVQWIWLEMGANVLQPTLFIMAMMHLRVDMSWWGNTTLGCYVFHFYFKSHATMLIEQTCAWLAGLGLAGLPQFFFVLGGCAAFTTFGGPLGHYALLSPYLLWVRASRSKWLKELLMSATVVSSSAGAGATTAKVPMRHKQLPPQGVRERSDGDTSVGSSSESENESL